MKILITGGSGLLRQYLNIHLSKNHSVLSVFNMHLGNCKDYNSIKADINDRKELNNIFKSFNPDAIVHSAAVSSLQLALQINPKLVYDTNVNSTRYIAELCLQYEARLVYTSTDLVCAGYRGSRLNEDAKLIPVSLYAETKLMGEVKIRETFDNFLILRIALLYGLGLNNSYNHFHQMYLNLLKGIPVKLFTDQYRTPIELNITAEIINHLLEQDIKNEVINLGGRERVSRYQLGEILCDTAGFNKNLLQKITMDEFPDLPKVEDVSMDTTKLQSYGIKQDSIEKSIARLIKLKN